MRVDAQTSLRPVIKQLAVRVFLGFLEAQPDEYQKGCSLVAAKSIRVFCFPARSPQTNVILKPNRDDGARQKIEIRLVFAPPMKKSSYDAGDRIRPWNATSNNTEIQQLRESLHSIRRRWTAGRPLRISRNQRRKLVRCFCL